jgi:hypothetical protein
MGMYQSEFLGGFIGWGCAVEKNFHLAAGVPAVFAQDLDQVLFIIHITQVHPRQLRDEIVPINHNALQLFLHAFIVPSNYAIIPSTQTMKKLLPYLLLNIMVSALTMLAVILIWNAAHPTPILPGNLDTPASPQAIIAQPTTIPLDQPTVEVQAVLIPGDLNNERVLIRNISQSALDLKGWSVKDENGNQYDFPTLTLFPGGVIGVYSAAGTDTSIALYWGRTDPVWQSGETVYILDPENNERAIFKIP